MKKLIFATAIIGSMSCFAASKTSDTIALDEKIQLQSKLEFVEDGAWTISCTPIYSNLVAVNKVTNAFGVVTTTYTYTPELSKYALNKKLLDTITGFSVASKPVYSVVPVTSGLVATINDDGVISANKEGAVTVIANDGDRIITKNLAFKIYSIDSKVSYYTGDTNDYVNTLYTEWYSYVTNRDPAIMTTIKGYNNCKGKIAHNDFLWSDKQFRYYMGPSYSSDLYIPVSNVCFRMLDTGNAIKYSGNAIGSKVSLTSSVYNDISGITESKVYNHKWMKPDGSNSVVKTTKAVNLNAWAKSKAIYTDYEVTAVANTVAYVYESEIPSECQASILRATIYGDVNKDAPNSTNCIALTRSPGFSITQHGTVVPQYFIGGCGYNANGVMTTISCSNADYRKDGEGIDNIDAYHCGHNCDAGRPWFWIYNGETILAGAYHHSNESPSYSMAWRIIRDFCKENGSTCNLYDMINKEKIVVDPSL